jgi:hypothetical protein
MGLIGLKDLDQIVNSLPITVPKLQDGSFELDGLLYHFARIQQHGQSTLRFSAVLGYLPFTIESVPKRQLLQKIISRANQMAGINFNIDDQHQIRVDYTIPADDTLNDEDVFYHLVIFYQRARPFLQLIGEYL